MPGIRPARRRTLDHMSMQPPTPDYSILQIISHLLLQSKIWGLVLGSDSLPIENRHKIKQLEGGIMEGWKQVWVKE